MVELGDLAGGQADLVAVAGVAGGGGGHELALRELALHGLGHGDRGVGRAGHAHGLVDVAAAGERVADGAADAGGRAAKGLDLGGVVVGLVLEEEEPVLVLAVDVDGDLDGAGVNLLGLVEVLELARVLEPLGADRAHVHEAGRASRRGRARGASACSAQRRPPRPRRQTAGARGRSRRWCGGSGRTSRCQSCGSR